MGYLPNIDAAMWFATRIWPRLRAAVPFPLRFVIAGHGAPREVMDLGKTARHRRCRRLRRCRRRSTAALRLPSCRSGQGAGRASSCSKAPSTAFRSWRHAFGAAGTGFRSGQELLLADNERDFAASCARLLTDGRLASRLVAGARRKVRRDYDAGRSAKRLLDRIDAWLATGVK